MKLFAFLACLAFASALQVEEDGPSSTFQCEALCNDPGTSKVAISSDDNIASGVFHDDGGYHIEYKNDATGPVTVTFTQSLQYVVNVNSVADRPEGPAESMPYTVPEGAATDIEIDLTTLFRDGDGDALNFDVSGNSNPGLATVTLNTTTDTLLVEFSEGLSGKVSVTVKAFGEEGETMSGFTTLDFVVKPESQSSKDAVNSVATGAEATAAVTALENATVSEQVDIMVSVLSGDDAATITETAEQSKEEAENTSDDDGVGGGETSDEDRDTAKEAVDSTDKTKEQKDAAKEGIDKANTNAELAEVLKALMNDETAANIAKAGEDKWAEIVTSSDTNEGVKQALRDGGYMSGEDRQRSKDAIAASSATAEQKAAAEAALDKSKSTSEQQAVLKSLANGDSAEQIADEQMRSSQQNKEQGSSGGIGGGEVSASEKEELKASASASDASQVIKDSFEEAVDNAITKSDIVRALEKLVKNDDTDKPADAVKTAQDAMLMESSSTKLHDMGVVSDDERQSTSDAVTNSGTVLTTQQKTTASTALDNAVSVAEVAAILEASLMGEDEATVMEKASEARNNALGGNGEHGGGLVSEEDKATAKMVVDSIVTDTALAQSIKELLDSVKVSSKADVAQVYKSLLNSTTWNTVEEQLEGDKDKRRKERDQTSSTDSGDNSEQDAKDANEAMANSDLSANTQTYLADVFKSASVEASVAVLTQLLDPKSDSVKSNSSGTASQEDEKELQDMVNWAAEDAQRRSEDRGEKQSAGGVATADQKSSLQDSIMYQQSMGVLDDVKYMAAKEAIEKALTNSEVAVIIQSILNEDDDAADLGNKTMKAKNKARSASSSIVSKEQIESTITTLLDSNTGAVSEELKAALTQIMDDISSATELAAVVNALTENTNPDEVAMVAEQAKRDVEESEDTGGSDGGSAQQEDKQRAKKVIDDSAASDEDKETFKEIIDTSASQSEVSAVTITVVAGGTPDQAMEKAKKARKRSSNSESDDEVTRQGGASNQDKNEGRRATDENNSRSRVTLDAEQSAAAEMALEQSSSASEMRDVLMASLNGYPAEQLTATLKESKDLTAAKGSKGGSNGGLVHESDRDEVRAAVKSLGDDALVTALEDTLASAGSVAVLNKILIGVAAGKSATEIKASADVAVRLQKSGPANTLLVEGMPSMVKRLDTVTAVATIKDDLIANLNMASSVSGANDVLLTAFAAGATKAELEAAREADAEIVAGNGAAGGIGGGMLDAETKKMATDNVAFGTKIVFHAQIQNACANAIADSTTRAELNAVLTAALRPNVGLQDFEMAAQRARNKIAALPRGKLVGQGFLHWAHKEALKKWVVTETSLVPARAQAYTQMAIAMATTEQEAAAILLAASTPKANKASIRAAHVASKEQMANDAAPAQREDEKEKEDENKEEGSEDEDQYDRSYKSGGSVGGGFVRANVALQTNVALRAALGLPAIGADLSVIGTSMKANLAAVDMAINSCVTYAELAAVTKGVVVQNAEPTDLPKIAMRAKWAVLKFASPSLLVTMGMPTGPSFDVILNHATGGTSLLSDDAQIRADIRAQLSTAGTFRGIIAGLRAAVEFRNERSGKLLNRTITWMNQASAETQATGSAGGVGGGMVEASVKTAIRAELKALLGASSAKAKAVNMALDGAVTYVEVALIFAVAINGVDVGVDLDLPSLAIDARLKLSAALPGATVALGLTTPAMKRVALAAVLGASVTPAVSAEVAVAARVAIGAALTTTELDAIAAAVAAGGDANAILAAGLDAKLALGAGAGAGAPAGLPVWAIVLIVLLVVVLIVIIVVLVLVLLLSQGKCLQIKPCLAKLKPILCCPCFALVGCCKALARCIASLFCCCTGKRPFASCLVGSGAAPAYVIAVRGNLKLQGEGAAEGEAEVDVEAGEAGSGSGGGALIMSFLSAMEVKLALEAFLKSKIDADGSLDTDASNISVDVLSAGAAMAFGTKPCCAGGAGGGAGGDAGELEMTGDGDGDADADADAGADKAGAADAKASGKGDAKASGKGDAKASGKGEAGASAETGTASASGSASAETGGADNDKEDK